jgi:hypothetical protein
MTVELGELVTVTRFFRVAASRHRHPNAILKISHARMKFVSSAEISALMINNCVSSMRLHDADKMRRS